MKYDVIINSMVWSYSRLTAFENCRYQWLQKYIFGVGKAEKFFSQFGGFAHDLLQRHLVGELSAKNLKVTYLAEFRKKVTAPAPNEKIYNSYFEDGKRYFSDISFGNREILAVEKKLSF